MLSVDKKIKLNVPPKDDIGKALSEAEIASRDLKRADSNANIPFIF